MAIITKAGGRVTSKTGQSADYRQLMILTDRPVLFDPDVAELAELAKGLGLRIEIGRFDLDENKHSVFVLE